MGPILCTLGVVMSNIWHTAYVRWFDNDQAGATVRAFVWGWIADRLARFA